VPVGVSGFDESLRAVGNPLRSCSPGRVESDVPLSIGNYAKLVTVQIVKYVWYEGSDREYQRWSYGLKVRRCSPARHDSRQLVLVGSACNQ